MFCAGSGSRLDGSGASTQSKLQCKYLLKIDTIT